MTLLFETESCQIRKVQLFLYSLKTPGYSLGVLVNCCSSNKLAIKRIVL